MHIVKLRLKFEPQLDLLLVILRILRVVLLQFHTHRLLVHHFALQLLAQLLLHVQVLLEHLLVVGLLLGFLLVIAIEVLDLLLVLFRNLTDQHPVICSLAVLEQNCENLDSRNKLEN